MLTVLGCRMKREKLIDYPVRPNGNMQRGQKAQLRFGGVLLLTGIKPTITAHIYTMVEQWVRIGKRLEEWGISHPTLSVSTKFMAMSGNGCRTAGMIIMRGRHRMVRFGWVASGRIYTDILIRYCGVVLGTINPTGYVPPLVIKPYLTYALMAETSVSQEP